MNNPQSSDPRALQLDRTKGAMAVIDKVINATTERPSINNPYSGTGLGGSKSKRFNPYSTKF